MPKYTVTMLVTILAPDLDTAQNVADYLDVSCPVAPASVVDYEVTSTPRERDA